MGCIRPSNEMWHASPTHVLLQKMKQSQKIQKTNTVGGGSPMNEITPAREWNTVGGGSPMNEIKKIQKTKNAVTPPREWNAVGGGSRMNWCSSLRSKFFISLGGLTSPTLFHFFGTEWGALAPAMKSLPLGSGTPWGTLVPRIKSLPLGSGTQ